MKRDKPNINTATREELLHAGLDEATADQILRHRDEYGPFTTPMQADSIPQLGGDQLERAKAVLRWSAGPPL